MNVYNYPCLFFAVMKTAKLTDEHVVPSGFGSNWTLPKKRCVVITILTFFAYDKGLLIFAHEVIYAYSILMFLHNGRCNRASCLTKNQICG